MEGPISAGPVKGDPWHRPFVLAFSPTVACLLGLRVHIKPVQSSSAGNPGHQSHREAGPVRRQIVQPGKALEEWLLGARCEEA